MTRSLGEVESLMTLARTGLLTRRELLHRAMILGISGVSLAAFLDACSGSNSTTTGQNSGTPKRGGTLLMARISDSTGWDPMRQHGDNMTIWANEQVNRGLVKQNPSGSKMLPDLAESWDVSSDGLTITYHLRPNLKFSDGSPLKASDVLFSHHRAATSPKSPGRTTWPAGLTFSAKDDQTFVWHLQKPWPGGIPTRGPYAISSEAYWNKVGDDGFAAQPLGCGPFLLSEWRKGDRIILKRNPNYWDSSQPYLDEVDLIVVPDDNTRALQVQAGQIDIATDLSLTGLSQLQGASGVVVDLESTGAETLINLNENLPVYKDRNVRLALNYAIDKNAIVKTAFFGHATLTNSILPNMASPPPANTPYPYDVNMAKQVLAKTNYPTGFQAKLLTAAGDQVQAAIATIVQSQLAAIGVKVTIEPLEAATQGNDIGNEDYEMAIETFTVDFPDPGLIFQFAAIGGQFQDAMWTHYINPSVINLFFQAEAEADPNKRLQDYKELQNMVWMDAPDIFLANPQTATGLRSNVHGWQLLSNTHYRLEVVWKS